MKMLLERDPRAIAWRDKDGRDMLALARQTDNVDVETWLEKQYGEEGAGAQDVSMVCDTGCISAGIKVWRTVRTIGTPSVVIQVLLALLLGYLLSSRLG